MAAALRSAAAKNECAAGQRAAQHTEMPAELHMSRAIPNNPPVKVFKTALYFLWQATWAAS
eukprot:5333085-Pleurochrysis_carterae.AAC.1